MTLSLWDVQRRVNEIALDMMLRGVRIDIMALRQLDNDLEMEMGRRIIAVEKFLGYKLDKLNKQGEPTFFRSTPQIKALFQSLGQRPGLNRKSGNAAYDDEALFAIAKRTPQLKPLCFAIIEYRSMGTARSNFTKSLLDDDHRMRCSFNTAGPETFRWGSSKNAFWRGCNLQNVAKPFHALTGTAMPNLRSAICFDEGMIGWEPDLAGADARVVAWDADDAMMKQAFREGIKIHAVRAKEIYGSDAGPDGLREPYYTLAKKGGHLWNYGGKSRTMATSLGILVNEADKIIRRLVQVHPAVVQWHKRIASDLRAGKPITNAFGYQIHYQKRGDEALTDALAWIGQGTVACAINRALIGVADITGVSAWQRPGHTDLLLQEHDSLVGQTLTAEWSKFKPQIREQFLAVTIPYPDPLIIPPDLKTSRTNWGSMEKEAW